MYDTAEGKASSVRLEVTFQADAKVLKDKAGSINTGIYTPQPHYILLQNAPKTYNYRFTNYCRASLLLAKMAFEYANTIFIGHCESFLCALISKLTSSEIRTSQNSPIYGKIGSFRPPE